MRTLNFLFALTFVLMLGLGAVAQSDPAPPPSENGFDEAPDNRGRLIARALGLSESQQIEIREINRKQRQHLRVAQLRLQAARAAADVAIYDDLLDTKETEKRIQEVALAQAEITRIRMMSEVAVRTVLSPEQLVRFRTMREQFKNRRRLVPRQRRNSNIPKRDDVNHRPEPPNRANR